MKKKKNERKKTKNIGKNEKNTAKDERKNTEKKQCFRGDKLWLESILKRRF